MNQQLKHQSQTVLRLLVSIEEQLKALEEASHGIGEVWADLPGRFLENNMLSDGNAVSLKLSADFSDEEWEVFKKNKVLPDINLKAPFRLRLFPKDCARLFRSKSVEVQRFVPPPVILKHLDLDAKGVDENGLQWEVYTLFQEKGIMSYPVEISRDRLYAPMIDENLNLPKNTIPARKKKPSNPRSPVIIFILDEIKKRRTKWENAWKKLRSLADGQTYRTYGNSNYLLCKIDVPHPKRLNSLIPAVEFEEDTNPPKKISIQRYSFRDTFQRLIKK